jgi:hypothetical protein
MRQQQDKGTEDKTEGATLKTIPVADESIATGCSSRYWWLPQGRSEGKFPL